MKNLRLVMKTVTNAVTTEFPYHGEAIVLSVLLDRVSYVAEMCARTNLPNAKV